MLQISSSFPPTNKLVLRRPIFLSYFY
jgi:hypothetical protein